LFPALIADEDDEDLKDLGRRPFCGGAAAPCWFGIYRERF
jgi:hypothetical protein